MDVLTTTPFGPRAVSAGHLARQILAKSQAPVTEHNKWELFRSLCASRETFGLKDRDLTVLNALLSFHRGDLLKDGENLIVFPSNRILAERAHGMAESTLRRHLAALCRAGVLLRHDSPNGKRYARKDASGEMLAAFGFNLRPLLVKAAEISEAAEGVRKAAEALKVAKERMSLLLRDAGKLLEFAASLHPELSLEQQVEFLAEARKLSRRKTSIDQVQNCIKELRRLTDDLCRLVETKAARETEKKNGNDSQNGRHYHNSKPDSYEFEPVLEKSRGAGVQGCTVAADEPLAQNDEEPDCRNDRHQDPPVPLILVRKACPEIELYAKDGICSWHHLAGAAAFVRSMLGISPTAWDEACRVMGTENAAVTVACILERAGEINSPGGYLRALTVRAADRKFSTGPMVLALLNKDRSRG